jgi:hypothetical protein
MSLSTICRSAPADATWTAFILAVERLVVAMDNVSFEQRIDLSRERAEAPL